MTQTIAPIDLMGLAPKQAEFRLGDYPNRHFTLCRWSLRVRAWAVEKYGTDKLNAVFTNLQIGEIADIAWFMLLEKDAFNGEFVKFLDSISSTQDQLNLINALLGSVGIGEPEIEKIMAAQAKAGGKQVPPPKPLNRASRRKNPTGPKSSTR